MSRVKTGIVMMNLGGPADLTQVEPFLLELFADREIIQLPFQGWLGPFITRRRTPKVQALYRNIGGGSPILRYTEAQSVAVQKLLRFAPMFGMKDETFAKVMTAQERLMKKLGRA